MFDKWIEKLKYKIFEFPSKEVIFDNDQEIIFDKKFKKEYPSTAKNENYNTIIKSEFWNAIPSDIEMDGYFFQQSFFIHIEVIGLALSIYQKNLNDVSENSIANDSPLFFTSAIEEYIKNLSERADYRFYGFPNVAYLEHINDFDDKKMSTNNGYASYINNIIDQFDINKRDLDNSDINNMLNAAFKKYSQRKFFNNGNELLKEELFNELYNVYFDSDYLFPNCSIGRFKDFFKCKVVSNSIIDFIDYDAKQELD